jgi:hypothetical protein
VPLALPVLSGVPLALPVNWMADGRLGLT